jgi:hypothetical protein
MGINLQKMQKKLENLASNNENDSNVFKPVEGDQTIRIAPSKDEDPFKQFFLHYGLSSAPGGVLCPKRNFGESCAICELATTLWKTGVEEKDEDTKNSAKSFFAKDRYHSVVVVRGKEKEGAKVWGYGKTVYEKLLRTVLNPDYGDVTDPEDGIDFVLTYQKKPGEKYPSSDVVPRRKSSPIFKTDSECELFTGIPIAEFLDSIPNLSERYERKSSKEVAQLLEDHLKAAEENVSETEPTDDVGTEKYKGTSDSKRTETTSPDNEFDSKMNELLEEN